MLLPGQYFSRFSLKHKKAGYKMSDFIIYRPCYEGLVTNMPIAMSQFKNQAWAHGTPDFVNHRLVREYIQAAAQRSGPQTSYLYSTRVERIWKRESKWQLQSTALTRAANGNLKKSRRIRVRMSLLASSSLSLT